MADDEDVRTIWCGNLSEKVTYDILYELFYQAGPLDKVRIPRDQEGRQRNFGFITYTHQESVSYAIDLFRGTTLFDRKLNMKMQKGTEQKLYKNGNANPSSDFATMLGRPQMNVLQISSDIEPGFIKMTSQLISNNTHPKRESLLDEINFGVYDQHNNTNRLTTASLQGQWTSRHNPDRDRNTRRHEPYKDQRERNRRNERDFGRERDRNDRCNSNRYDRGSNSRFERSGGLQNIDDDYRFESRLDSNQDRDSERNSRRRAGENFVAERGRSDSNDRHRDFDGGRDGHRSSYRDNRTNRRNMRD